MSSRRELPVAWRAAAAPLVALLVGCGGSSTNDEDSGYGSVRDSASYETGYDVGRSLPATGEQGEMLCRESVNLAALNPAPGEDLGAALEGCLDAVNGR